MNKIVFEQDAPVGCVLVDIRELNVLKWVDYAVNFAFHQKGVHEQVISEIEKQNQDKILIIVNDNSNHGYVKRSFIRVYTQDELKRNL